MTYYQQVLENLAATPRTWLISGVAGFIGSHLAEKLIQHGQNVIGIDNFSSGCKENIASLIRNQHQFHFREIDIESKNDCLTIMQDVDYVLHHAALVSVPDSIKRPDVNNAINVTGFLNMLLAAHAKKVKRFIYASSSAVYGDVHNIPTQENELNMQLSPYGVSKYVNELYAKTLASCYDMRTIGLRYFNVFGPRQDPNSLYAAVIPRWITKLLNEETVEIYGDGETTRDFCYIENVIQANILAATVENTQALNQVYNIATGQEVSLNHLFRLLVDVLNLQDGKKVYLAFRPGDIRRSVAAIDKARAFLNYQPSHDLKAGLREVMHWYQLQAKVPA